MKAANTIVFQTINRGFNSAINIGLFGLNVVMNGKMFSFKGFLGFRKSFCGIERAFLVYVHTYIIIYMMLMGFYDVIC